jgi:hypothetical protein
MRGLHRGQYEDFAVNHACLQPGQSHALVIAAATDLPGQVDFAAAATAVDGSMTKEKKGAWGWIPAVINQQLTDATDTTTRWGGNAS